MNRKRPTISLIGVIVAGITLTALVLLVTISRPRHISYRPGRLKKVHQSGRNGARVKFSGKPDE